LFYKGISAFQRSIIGKRGDRYNKLKTLFYTKQQQTHVEGSLLLKPPNESDYLDDHATFNDETYRDCWLTVTAPIRYINLAVMRSIEIKKIIRIDHSQKFGKMLLVVEKNNQKNRCPDAKMLLCVQNEMHQIVARGFTRSENNEDTKAIFDEEIMSRINDGHTRILVSDNASKIRNLINEYKNIEVKQDPFHVITRFTEKVTPSVRKKLSRSLSRALFQCPGGELNDKATMKQKLKSALESVDESEITNVKK
jgi:hypothetical protein